MEKMIKLKENGFTVLDCFCGAGVGAVGTELAGFNTIYAFDNNFHAVRNFNKNIKDVAKVIDANFLNINDLPCTDVITGGFPCKPWSVAGKGQGEKCEKNGNLAQKLIEIILEKKPKAFLIENVKGLVNKKNFPYFEKMLEILSTKYKNFWKVIDCSEYGVPQKRERVFIIGISKKINKEFVFPEKSIKKYSINDALVGLPEFPDGKNNHEYHKSWTIRKDEEPFVHKISIGGNWKDLNEDDAKVFMKKAWYSGGGQTSYLAVMDRNKPARTILSTPMGKNTAQILRLSDDSHRRYTVRESLRLQTVPDSWGFDKETPIRIQYERCSGIPCLISYKLMKNLIDVLKD